MERRRLAVDETRLALLRQGTALLGVAGAIFVLSYADGGYASTTRAYAAIAAWWLLGVGAALGLGSARSQVSRLAIAATSLFGLFALWILTSLSVGGTRSAKLVFQLATAAWLLLLAIQCDTLPSTGYYDAQQPGKFHSIPSC